MKRTLLGLVLIFTCMTSLAELPVETIPQVETLPASYPIPGCMLTTLISFR